MAHNLGSSERGEKKIKGSSTSPKSRQKQRRTFLRVEFLERRKLLTTYHALSTGGPLLEPSGLVMQSSDLLQIDIAGDNQYGSVDVGGQKAVLGGNLSVSVPANYTPALGSKFQILSNATLGMSGSFSMLQLGTLGGNEALVPVQTSDGLWLVATDKSKPAAPSQLKVPSAQIGQVASFLDLPLPQAATYTVSNASLNVLGEEIDGTLTFGGGILSDGTPVFAISAQNVHADFGSGLNITQGAGDSATFFIMQNGVVGSASFSLSALGATLPLDLTGNVSLQVNTTGTAFNQTLKPQSGANLTVNVPAGPYLGVEVDSAKITIGPQPFNADSLFLQATTVTENGAPAKVLRGAVSNLTTTVGGQGVDVKLQNGTGAFDIQKNLLGNTLVAAQFSGNLGFDGLPSGLKFGSSIGFAYNNTGFPIKDTFTSNKGQTVSLDFTNRGLNTGSNFVQQFGGGLNLTLNDASNNQVLAIQGAFDIQGSSPTAAAPATVLVDVTNLNAFFGVDGGQPNATGLQISNGALYLAMFPPAGNATNGTYALQATGTAKVLGVPDLTLGGTVGVDWNTSGAVQNETFPTASGTQNITFANVNDVSGTNLTLNVANSAILTGNFGFSKTRRSTPRTPI